MSEVMNFAPSAPEGDTRKPDGDGGKRRRPKGIVALAVMALVTLVVVVVSVGVRTLVSADLSSRASTAARIEQEATKYDTSVDSTIADMTSTTPVVDTERVSADTDLIKDLLDESTGWYDQRSCDAAKAAVVDVADMASDSTYLGVVFPSMTSAQLAASPKVTYELGDVSVASVTLVDGPHWAYLYAVPVTITESFSSDTVKNVERHVLVTCVSDGTRLSDVSALLVDETEDATTTSATTAA